MIKIYCAASWRCIWFSLAILLISFECKAFVQDSASITLHASNTPIEMVFRQIEKQTGYSFYYSKPTLNGDEPVSVSLNKASITVAMNVILKGKNVNWQIKDGGIILSKKITPANLNNDTIPRINISGKVVDPQGNALPGVTVSIKGQNRGIGTDNLGRFGFVNVPLNATLIVSSIGYETKQVKLSAQESYIIPLDTLIRDIKAVEIVSTGYQTVNKNRTTGSFSQIDNELFNRDNSSNALDRILNVTSGLNYEARRVNNGITPAMRVRGISTINANQFPLIVVDNFPYEGDINNIDPNDIESVTVLKDAAAASIWGVRAGNGVIVITTKKGRLNKKANIQFSSNVILGDKPNIFDIPTVGSGEYIDLEKDLYAKGFYASSLTTAAAIRNRPIVSQVVEILAKRTAGSISQAEADLQIDNLRKIDVKNDINKYLIQKSLNQQYSVNISGGGENNIYYASLGYNRNKPNEVGNLSNRITARLDNTFKVSKKLEISGFVSYTKLENENNGIGYLLPTGNKIAPYTRLADSEGKSLAIPGPSTEGLRMAYLDTARYPALLDWYYRPLDELRNKNEKVEQVDLRLGIGMKYTILKGLTAEAKYQYQKTSGEETAINNQNTFFTRNLINRFMTGTPASVKYPIPLGGILDLTNRKSSNWNIRTQLNFDHAWSDFRVSALAGAEIREAVSDYSRTRSFGYSEETGQTLAIDYITTFVYRPGTAARVLPRVEQFGGNINRYLSYFANGSLTFRDKYTLDLSGRVDGSNFYGIKANQRIVPLWSVGGAWNVAMEEFYRLEILPALKFRLTYGYNGNTNNSGTAYSTIRYGTNLDINAPSASLVSPPNPELRWERIQVVNAGVDFGFAGSRVYGSVDVYRKKGVDLISGITVDPTVGVSTYVGNNATILVKGVDVVLNFNLINKRTFNWSSQLLFNYNSDKVLSYNVKPASPNDYFTESTPIIGKPLYKLYSYEWAGLDPLKGDPQVYIDNKVTSYNVAATNRKISDLKFNGSTLPQFFGSYRNDITIGDVLVSLNLVYKLGYYIRRNSINYSGLYTGWGGHSDYSNRWKAPGDELLTNIPSAPATTDANRDVVYSLSDHLVEKGDHLRFQDAKVTYRFKNNFIKNGIIKNLQVYGLVSNIGIIWRANKSGIDPEYNNFGGTPPPKSYSVGLSMNL